MSIAAKTAEECRHLIVHHGVHGDRLAELRHLLFVGEFAVQQQIADFQERGMFGKLVYWIAAIEKNPFVAVDEGDVAFAACGRGKAWIVRKDIGLAIELANVDDGW